MEDAQILIIIVLTEFNLQGVIVVSVHHNYYLTLNLDLQRKLISRKRIQIFELVRKQVWIFQSRSCRY